MTKLTDKVKLALSKQVFELGDCEGKCIKRWHNDWLLFEDDSFINIQANMVWDSASLSHSNEADAYELETLDLITAEEAKKYTIAVYAKQTRKYEKQQLDRDNKELERLADKLGRELK